MLTKGATYKQLKAYFILVIDWVADSMSRGTQAEHLEPNVVQTIARFSMIWELYLWLEDIKYLGKTSQSSTESESSITWDQFVNHLRDYFQFHPLELRGILTRTS